MNVRREVKILILLASAYVLPLQAYASGGAAASNAAASNAAASNAAASNAAASNAAASSVYMTAGAGAQAQGATPNQCVFYTYDKNGNRLKQENAPVSGSGATWGGSRYLCFVWGS